MNDGGVEDDRRNDRERMVDIVASHTDIEDDRVLDALAVVPRHAFVPPGRRANAYDDRPLPIGDGQTISAPHMVAIMVDRLALEPADRVLEIGTGCGYHAAVTAEYLDSGTVYSVEYSDDLADQARSTLEHLGYDNVEVRTDDGREGWPEHAPYDAAYLTCAAPSFPDAVVEQVRPGGRLLAPLGTGRQTLVFARKREDDTLEKRDGEAVRFVPMRG
ncbi:protein-L-isoaspartate(D-aspartate) O-methyltransferase [Natrialbaceae archaeon A-CW1-1]